MQGKQIKVIKREQKAQMAAQRPAPEAKPAPVERELREVVSGWVREHQRRTEEFRQNYSTLLSSLGFKSPAAGRLAVASALNK